MSDIHIQSRSEIMEQVFNDLRNNPPKPLAESSYLKRLPVHERYVSTFNLTDSSAANTTVIKYISMPNLKFQLVSSDVRRLESQKHDDSEISLEGKLCEPTPNIPAVSSVRPNLDGDGPELFQSPHGSLEGSVSIPDIPLPVRPTTADRLACEGVSPIDELYYMASIRRRRRRGPTVWQQVKKLISQLYHCYYIHISGSFVLILIGLAFLSI